MATKPGGFRMKKVPFFIYSPSIMKYQFHKEHPLNPQRLELTYDLIQAFQLLNSHQIIVPRAATNQELSLIHDPNYIDFVKKINETGTCQTGCPSYGIGNEDTPPFAGMHDVTSLIVGGAIQAGEMVMEGKTDHVLHMAGGLHHAFQKQASGFCIYNDASVLIAFLRKEYNARVLYLDKDAHHGDGVQWAFYEDPNVLTLSIHETGRYLFPGTGHVGERGNGEGFGYSVNVPLDAFTEDDSFLEVLYEVVPKVVERFQPDIIISQNGCDAHSYDPLTHLHTSMRIYQEIPRLVHQLAHQYTNGKWVALGGGGYDIWRVVPRAWTLLWAEMNDQSLEQQALPITWIERWQKESPMELPTYLFDDINTFPKIARKDEIEEKNRITIEKALETLSLIQRRTEK